MPPDINPEDLPNGFSNYFKTKIDNIRKAFKESTTFSEFDDETDAKLCQFKTQSVEEISRLIKNSSSKQCILDPIPTRLLKECNSELSPVITKIINLSIETSTVPTEFKQAVVTPLVKKPNAKLEYKIIDQRQTFHIYFKIKVISCQLKEYKQENRLDEPLQSAYKHSHSTQTALLKVFNGILAKMDDKELVFLTLLDLSAAFGTVDHHIFVKCLRSCFGITEIRNICKWQGKLSTAAGMLCTSSSLLGPLFYSDNTRPLDHLLHSLGFQFHLYADDSQLITSIPGGTPTDQSIVINLVQNGVKQIGEWMK